MRRRERMPGRPLRVGERPAGARREEGRGAVLVFRREMGDLGVRVRGEVGRERLVEAGFVLERAPARREAGVGEGFDVGVGVGLKASRAGKKVVVGVELRLRLRVEVEVSALGRLAKMEGSTFSWSSVVSSEALRLPAAGGAAGDGLAGLV